MTDKTSAYEEKYGISPHSFSKLERSVEFIDYKIKQEIPLSVRISILEEKFNNEINTLKKDLSEAKSEAKFKMVERLVYFSIIVGLITTLITLKLTGNV